MLCVAPEILTVLDRRNRQPDLLQLEGDLERGEWADPGSDGVPEGFDQCRRHAVAQPQVIPPEVVARGLPVARVLELDRHPCVGTFASEDTREERPWYVVGCCVPFPSIGEKIQVQGSHDGGAGFG